jgi:hypothetical protein
VAAIGHGLARASFVGVRVAADHAAEKRLYPSDRKGNFQAEQCEVIKFLKN